MTVGYALTELGKKPLRFHNMPTVGPKIDIEPFSFFLRFFKSQVMLDLASLPFKLGQNPLQCLTFLRTLPACVSENPDDLHLSNSLDVKRG